MWINLFIMATVTIELPRPHPAQQQVLDEARRFNVVACGRRWGKTDMGIALNIETALAGHPAAWFAPTYKLLEEAWERFDQALPQQVIKAKNKSERTIKLHTGGQLDFWTLKATSREKSLAGRGRKYKRAVVDEAAIATNLKQDWTQAIRPTLADLIGDAWFFSTPHGQDYFYQLYRKGQDGGHWASWQMATERNPFISPQEIKDAQEELPKDAFEQEWLAQFLANAANPFGLEYIRACINDSIMPGNIRWWGADLAKSQDWTVAIGLNEQFQTAAFQRWQSNWTNTGERLAAMFKHVPALVDSTGVGDPIVEQLKKRCPNVEGYVFSQQSKQRLMEGLAWAIQRKEVEYPSGPIVDELESFRYEYTRTGVKYSAPEGLHDDCVCALALAVMCKANAPVPVSIWGGGNDNYSVETDRYATGYDWMEDDRGWEPV